MEIRIQYNKRSKKVEALINFLKTLDFISIESISKELPYNKDFVKEVKEAANSKKRISVNPDDVWVSITDIN